MTLTVLLALCLVCLGGVQTLGDEEATGGLNGESSMEFRVSRLEKELDKFVVHWEKSEVEKFGMPQVQHIQETLMFPLRPNAL
tara:strand:+ start:401 stop:649 length:249 start_codon:yes stop_codon:yes gene_type:complete